MNLRSLLAVPALALALSFSAQAENKVKPGLYNIDPAHTTVGFTIEHFVISIVSGRFNDVSGTIVLAEKINDWKIDALVKTASVDTGVAKRDDHLRSADFFETSKYSDMRFVSKKISGSPNDFKITGDLTLKGVTKEITLKGKYRGVIMDSWKNQRIAIEAHGKINRKDFNVNYNDKFEGGPTVGDEVKIHLITEGTLASPK